MAMAARGAMARPESSLARPVILFLHNRYRVPGGEEHVVEDLVWLVREHLGEDAESLKRESAALGRARAAAGLLAGGLEPGDVAAAIRRTGARVVHAHNLLPTFGPRALAAARAAGARAGGRGRARSCICTTTGWSAPSRCASPTARTARAATVATPCRAC